MKGINLQLSAMLAVMLVARPATPAVAQRVLELPLRTGVGADALATGPVAVFWNAGAIGLPAGQGEALLVDSRGPAATGLDGIGLAGVYRMDERTAVAAGFLHSGIDDMERTTTSPLPEDGAIPIDLSENTFSVAALRQMGSRTSVGAGIRYTRGAKIVGGDNNLAFGAGLRFAGAARAGFTPELGVATFLDEDGADWFAGASLARAVGPAGEWRVGGEYGVRSSPRFDGVEHRVAATAVFRDRIRGGAGVSIEPGIEGSTVEPAASVSLMINRYVLGIVREQLPNDLGSIHQFRFSVNF